MSESIPFHDPRTDRDYVLEFDRDSVRFAESIGLNLAVLADAKRIHSRDIPIATMWSQLFYAGLIKHHPDMTQELSDDIWERVPNKPNVFFALLDMFQEPYQTLLSDDGDIDPKDVVEIKLPRPRSRKR